MIKITIYLLNLTWLLIMACSTKVDDIRPSSSVQDINLPSTGITSLESEKDLGVLMNQIGNSKFVLLGEASHGTSEFYTWRAL